MYRFQNNQLNCKTEREEQFNGEDVVECVFHVSTKVDLAHTPQMFLSCLPVHFFFITLFVAKV